MDFDREAARKTLEERARARKEKLGRLAARVARDADTIVRMLAREYRPFRIYQWGSLLEPGMFREWSDIDIAVEGLAGPLTGLEAADRAAGMTDIPVDLVELERIHPKHADDIRTGGRLVYERK